MKSLVRKVFYKPNYEVGGGTGAGAAAAAHDAMAWQQAAQRSAARHTTMLEIFIKLG